MLNPKVFLIVVAASAFLSSAAIGKTPIKIYITQEAAQSKSKSGRLIFDFLPKEYEGRGFGIVFFKPWNFDMFGPVFCGANSPPLPDALPDTSLVIVHSPNTMDSQMFQSCLTKLSMKSFDTDTGAIHVLSSPTGDSDQKNAVLEILVHAVGN